MGWFIKRILKNELFIILVAEIMICVMDREVTDEEKEKIRARILELIENLL